MSLNNISLPLPLLATLYHQSLVEGSTRPIPSKKKTGFLGGNKKNILIIVSHSSALFLPDDELAFLTKVLSACQLHLSDVAIVNRHHANEDDSLLLQFSPKEILFLDIPAEALNFSPHTPQYEVQKKDAIKYVYAPSLSEIQKTKKAKSQLWVALKQLFCL